MLVPRQVLGLQRQTGRQVVEETESKQVGSQQGGGRAAGATKTGPDDRAAAAVPWMDAGKPLPKG